MEQQLRSSRLATVSHYAYQGGQFGSREQRARTHAMNITVAGTWSKHGKRGVTQLVAGNVALDEAGDSSTCSHSAPHENIGIWLREGAIDPDLPALFEHTVLTIPAIDPMVRRAIAAECDDDFDSRVFEMFDWVSRSGKSSGRMRMQRAKRFIEHHALEDITLGTIAEKVGLSPFVCLRQFKAAHGVTPYAFLMQCRAEEAQRLLRSATVSIAEVARMSGFTDTSYFHRFFKRATGITPAQFRALYSAR